MLISENYNLNGLEVKSTALSWPPHYTVDNCNQDGEDCATSYGYVADYIAELASRYNFTFSANKDKDDDWGYLPKDGVFNISGTWGGVMGDVVTKKYDMSASTWWWSSDRDRVLDFVAICTDEWMLVLTPQQPTDFSLFTRCFTNTSWVAISCTLIIVVLLTFVQKCVAPDDHKNADWMFTFTIWLFFLLIHSFYSGALTNFFIGTTEIGFSTRNDVFREYPRWKYLLKKDAEMRIYDKVLQGDMDHIEFWERWNKDKAGNSFANEKEGFEKIKKGRYVIESAESMLLGYLRNNPTDQKLHFFGQSGVMFLGLIFHLNSPLVPIFKHGALHIRESGMERQMWLKWMPPFKGSGNSAFEKSVLTAGQTFVIFMILMGTFIVTVLFLVTEMVYVKVKKYKSRQGEEMGSHNLS